MHENKHKRALARRLCATHDDTRVISPYLVAMARGHLFDSNAAGAAVLTELHDGRRRQALQKGVLVLDHLTGLIQQRDMNRNTHMSTLHARWHGPIDAQRELKELVTLVLVPAATTV